MTGGTRDSAPERRRSTAVLFSIALVTLGLAAFTTHEIISLCGRPAVPLDDSYIHFQYAKALSELHAFRYTKGAAPTPGATSLLWPVLLAPFHALGLHAEKLSWGAWLLGFVAFGGVAHEIIRLSEGLVSRGAALAAGAMSMAFGGFVWFAASGMEVLPFAWLLTRTARRCAEWMESASAGAQRSSRSTSPEGSASGSERGDRAEGEKGGGEAPRKEGAPPHERSLLALAFLAPLMRPEGALASLMVFAVLFARPRGSRSVSFLALLGPLGPSLVCLLFTGQALQSTALAKWLPLNPYYSGARLWGAISYNVRIFFGTLLDGRLWTSVFLPEGGRAVAVFALFAVPVLGIRQRKLPRALLVLALSAGALIPTTYETFLVNRVRYIWPFFGGWFVALAALSEILGEALTLPFKRWSLPAPPGGAIVGAGFAALLATKMSWTVRDLAESAHAISLQQVSLAEWAKVNLPESSRLGVNDTGALAYFSNRSTFDVVGLTTSGEARYWTAGPGSRFEHYERLPRSELPTHFVVYPEWFGIDPLLGEELTHRSVRHTILGGVTMGAYVARYDLLRSGERPETAELHERRPLDTLDVSDVESERAHAYELFDATRERNVVLSEWDVADGGRCERASERFVLTLAPAGQLVARWFTERPASALLEVDGHALETVPIEEDTFREVRIALPGDLARGPHSIRISARGHRFCSLHYWSYE